MRGLACLLLAAAATSQKTVGVCVVLTHFVYEDRAGVAHLGELRDLTALFGSLKDQKVCRCLVSDFGAHRVRISEKLRRIDKAAAVDDWVEALTWDEVQRMEPAVFARWNTSNAFPHILVHYLTKILAYDRLPYDVTLYLDDDMYACFDVGFLGDALLELAETGPVRLSDRRLSQGEASLDDSESRQIARYLHDGRPPALWRHFDLQGGAVLLKRSPRQQRFAAYARRAFVDLWSGTYTKAVIASINGTDSYDMVAKAVGLRRKRNTDHSSRSSETAPRPSSTDRDGASDCNNCSMAGHRLELRASHAGRF
jgi:hypothetical protein